MKNEVPNIVGEVINAADGKLPPENITDARELLDHNEWGEALSLIYTQLYEYDVRIPQSIFDMIKYAGTKMEMDNKGWECLEVDD